MAEWLYEAGIGEARAALVEQGRIVAARIERPGSGPLVGAVCDARLVDSREGRVMLADRGEALLNGPAGVTEGAALRVEIVREAIPERGRLKLPRAVATGAPLGDGPDLLARITAHGLLVRQCRAHQPDALEDAGWSEVLEEARTGDIAFPGGALRMTPTPAMTLFDVDGSGPLETLALAAATAVAHAIRRHGIGGSIGVDFPTLPGKPARQTVAAAIDAVLPPPFERTTVNGFGFVQIVRRRPRASLPELLAAETAMADALALLRTIERTPPPVASRHTVPARILQCLDAHPDWVTDLSRRTGVAPIFTLS